LELIKSAFPDITQTNELTDIEMELGENLYYYVLELTNNYQNCNQTLDYDIETMKILMKMILISLTVNS
jgi:hypothetical protein